MGTVVIILIIVFFFGGRAFWRSLIWLIGLFSTHVARGIETCVGAIGRLIVLAIGFGLFALVWAILYALSHN